MRVRGKVLAYSAARVWAQAQLMRLTCVVGRLRTLPVVHQARETRRSVAVAFLEPLGRCIAWCALHVLNGGLRGGARVRRVTC